MTEREIVASNVIRSDRMQAPFLCLTDTESFGVVGHNPFPLALRMNGDFTI